MKIETLVLGLLETNCYLVSAAPGMPVIIIDPADKPQRILDEVGNRKVAGIILTHRHFDHIGALPEVARATGAPVLAGARDADALLDPQSNLSEGFTIAVAAERVDYRLHDGDVIHVDASGALTIRHDPSCDSSDLCLLVRETPGHTTGSIVLILEDGDAGKGDASVCFSGDTLFANGFGRTDLPTGSHREIVHSIKDVLFQLPRETCVFSGHGPTTTIGSETRTFPF